MMRPALTPDEWAGGRYESRDLIVSRRPLALDGTTRLGVTVHAYPLGGTGTEGRDLHALAGLCLDGLEIDGERVLSREDVEWIRFLESGDCPKCEGDGWKLCAPPICTRCGWKASYNVNSLADRLESLLPPES